MSIEIPNDVIRNLQISLRKAANLSSYDPDAISLPTTTISRSSLSETLASLDPSPPYLRCKHCNARLLRGIQSFICVFCGSPQTKDLPPEPLLFPTSFGYKWLLDALDVDGSEMVGSVEANESKRGKRKPKDEVPLSDLLNLEIRWSAESEKVGTVSNETVIQSKSSLNLVGVDLDNFFAEGKRDVAFSASEEQLIQNNQIDSTEGDAFQVRENLSLFENVQPSETATRPMEDDSGDSFSGWAANFQSAGSGTFQVETKSFDPFVGASGDLSTQMDTVFGPAQNSSDAKAKDNTILSASMNNDWFQEDLWSNSNSEVTSRPEHVEMTANINNGRIAENVNNSSSMSVGLVQDDLWQTSSNKAPDNKPTDEDDDSFDAWNDFTSSTSAQDPSNSSWKQTVNPTTPSVEQPSEMNLFGLENNSKDMDFGSFSQPDIFSGALSNPNDSPEVSNLQSGASASDRMSNVNLKAGWDAEDVTKDGDVSSGRTTSNADNVETLMSQMHDLSFMLESNLSIPQK